MEHVPSVLFAVVSVLFASVVMSHQLLVGRPRISMPDATAEHCQLCRRSLRAAHQRPSNQAASPSTCESAILRSCGRLPAHRQTHFRGHRKQGASRSLDYFCLPKTAPSSPVSVWGPVKVSPWLSLDSVMTRKCRRSFRTPPEGCHGHPIQSELTQCPCGTVFKEIKLR